MISVSHLIKKFPGHIAVNDLSFEVERGEIVGFLGLNGAGKTTTLRILAGYLPASGGDVIVAGRNVFTDSLEVRQRIGYLPEQCPLYPELRVDEYLRFRAKLKGVVPRKQRRRIQEVKELCSLEKVGSRIIGQLSKGYRQRVGLAEALVHEPELLILDEPTIGLDPSQIRQVRKLISRLAQKHTIFLSMHVLSEVEMICQRVLILHHGKLVASDSPENLRRLLQKGMQIVTEISGDPAQVEGALKHLPFVKEVARDGSYGSWSRYRIQGETDRDIRPELFQLAVQHNWVLRELYTEEKSLEDLFITLTEK